MSKKKSTEYLPTAQELHGELQATAQALRCAYDRFNYVCDPDLVEAAIFEIDSLKAQYSYLLRCIKELSGVPLRRNEHRDCVAASAGKGGSICRS